jgi:hypothetical protein
MLCAHSAGRQVGFPADIPWDERHEHNEANLCSMVTPYGRRIRARRAVPLLKYSLTSLGLANGGIIRIRMRVDTLRFRLGRYPVLA